MRHPFSLPRSRRAAAATTLAVLALLAGCAQRGSARPERACGLDAAAHAQATRLVKAIVDNGQAPGVVADIRCDGQPWLTLAHGVADTVNPRPMRQDDLFRIYSMSKPVTALAALLLVDEGRIALDDPVARHLPEFTATPVFAGDGKPTQPQQPPLTVRDLLRHTAGLPYLAPLPHPVLQQYVAKGIDNGSGQRIVPGDGSAPVASVAELSRRIASIPLLHQPGERFTYGSASDVLGHLVETVSRQRLGDFLQQRLFKPLQMGDTGFAVPAAALPRLTAAYSAASQRPQADYAPLNEQRSNGLARSTLARVDAAPSSVYAQRRAIDFGGAGLVSTAADYQAFLRLLLQDGGGRLSPRLVAEMGRNQLGSSARASTAMTRQGLGYGLGIAVFEGARDTAAPPAPAAPAVPAAPGALLRPRQGQFWGGAASTYFWVDRERRITGVLMTQVFGGDVAPYFPELMDLIERSARQP